MTASQNVMSLRMLFLMSAFSAKSRKAATEKYGVRGILIGWLDTYQAQAKEK